MMSRRRWLPASYEELQKQREEKAKMFIGDDDDKDDSEKDDE